MHLHTWLIVAVGLLIAADDKGDAAKKDADKLQGTWKLVSLEVNGKPATKRANKEQTMVVDGDKFAATIDDKHSFKGTFKLDPTRKPKVIDVLVTEGEFQGKTLLGIYEMDKDTLRTCIVPPGKDRPTEFVTKPGSGIYLFSYKRAKP